MAIGSKKAKAEEQAKLELKVRELQEKLEKAESEIATLKYKQRNAESVAGDTVSTSTTSSSHCVSVVHKGYLYRWVVSLFHGF